MAIYEDCGMSIVELLSVIMILLFIIIVLILSMYVGIKDMKFRFGYQPKGYITKIIGGKPVNIPIDRLNIIPPKGGTAAVYLPGRKQ
jgi:hypothetical protein